MKTKKNKLKSEENVKQNFKKMKIMKKWLTKKIENWRNEKFKNWELKNE